MMQFTQKIQRLMTTVGVILSLGSTAISQHYINKKYDDIDQLRQDTCNVDILIENVWDQVSALERSRQSLIVIAGQEMSGKRVQQAVYALLSSTPHIPKADIKNLDDLVIKGDFDGFNHAIDTIRTDYLNQINNAYTERLDDDTSINLLKDEIDQIGVIVLCLQAIAMVCLLGRDVG